MSSNNFEIEIVFKELRVSNAIEPEAADNLEIVLIHSGVKVGRSNAESEDSIQLRNGKQKIDVKFRMKNAVADVSEDEFVFDSLGEPVSVMLVKVGSKKTTRKSMKKPKENVTISKGMICLLTNLKRFEMFGMDTFRLSLKAFNDEISEIEAFYDIGFVNHPVVAGTLSVQVVPVFSHSDEELDVWFHFPIAESKFKAVRLNESTPVHLHHESFITDESIRSFKFDFGSKAAWKSLKYENIQQYESRQSIKQLIQSNKSLLFEVRRQNQTFMTFVDLTVFNYENVTEAAFMVPLYHRSVASVVERFKQDLRAFNEPENDVKKSKSFQKPSKVDIEIEQGKELRMLMLDNHPALIFIKVKLSRAINPETSVDDLKAELNKQFLFVEEISLKDQTVSICEENFKNAVENLANQLKDRLDCADGQPELDNTELKLALKDLIGNKLHVGKKTETNHEFKLSLIETYKTLSSEMHKILEAKEIESSHYKPALMSRELRKVQVEEWILMKEYDKAHETFRKELEDEVSVQTFIDFSIFLLRAGMMKECEEKLCNVLRMDSNIVAAFYVLTYLKMQSGNIELAILSMRIASKLQPGNLEFKIILMMLYKLANNNSGVSYCEMKTFGTRFIDDDALDVLPLLQQNVCTDDSIERILRRQKHLRLREFLAMTNEFVSMSPNYHGNEIIALQTAFTSGTLNTAILKLEKQENRNQQIAKFIMKGDLCYLNKRHSDAICEYERAFELCSMQNEKFPHGLALRCGNWNLNEAKDFQKARQFFESCSATFKALMGLAIVKFEEGNYIEAEKLFASANKIDNKSGDNWLYLALTNHHLGKQNLLEQCFFIARQLTVQNSCLIERVERALKF